MSAGEKWKAPHSNLWLPFHDKAWRDQRVCLLNAPQAPGEDVHLRVPRAKARGPSETVLLQVKRFLAKDLSPGAISEELSKTGVEGAEKNSRFSSAARSVRAGDGTDRRSFVFVAAFGPNAKRTAKWPAVRNWTPGATSNAEGVSVVVMFHEGHVDALGRFRTKSDGTRPFVYPLFLGGLGKEVICRPENGQG